MTKYSEGDWFAVPLRDSRFAVGVVARANPEGVLLGYFFGPARDDVPRIDELDRLDASNADLARKFGDLGLRSGTWPLIGSLSSWDRNQWPMPDFRRYEELTGRTFVVTYSDADPNQVERERLSTPDDTINLPKDGLAGAGFVEVVLTELLRRHS